MQGVYYTLNSVQDAADLINEIRAIDFRKGPICVKVEPKVPKRSLLQNAYLWGWIYANIESQLDAGGIVIHCDNGQEVPYTKEILHEIFKRKYLVVGVIESKGKSLEIYRSSTELSTIEFCEFVRNIEKFVYQFWQITVPQPMGQQLKQWQQWADEAKRAA